MQSGIAAADERADERAAGADASDVASARSQEHLLALYTFDDGQGQVIRDRSGVGVPLNLRIENREAVRWTDGRLRIRRDVRIASAEPASKIIEGIMQSGEVTLEAWITPARERQTGPARIVTLSADPNLRNLTLGHEDRMYEVRLRTTSTSDNGMPGVATTNDAVRESLTHVVYTRDRRGIARIYVDGRQQAETRIAGDLGNWDGSYRLALGDELSGERSWRGEYELVAIYGRALSPDEAKQHFAAGPHYVPELLAGGNPEEQVFQSQIAPLLAQHCLECHDSSSMKGGLDLSRKEAALRGGDSGRAIAAGDSADSLLWHMVESDEMPKERPALAVQEKQLLQEWIEAGAVWPVDVIDPAVYTFDPRAAELLVQRLTVSEYVETVRNAVGIDVEKEARELLPRDLRADGFSNTAYNLNVDFGHVEAYSRLARIIVDRLDVMAFATRFTKSRELSDSNLVTLVENMGKWLFRGPLDEREVPGYVWLGTTVDNTDGDFEEAAGYIIEAMLQSPRFVYRIERQPRHITRWVVSDYELASRLSYILWGGPPDEELFKAADDGMLSNEDVLHQQVARMLQDPRAVEQSSRFVTDWLNLDRLQDLRPDRERFPAWDEPLAVDMRDETLAFFEEVVWREKRPLAHLLNAEVTFATPRLAAYYGLKPHDGDRLARYDLARVPSRGGLLTQGSLLTVGGEDASTVTRGLFVFDELLDGIVKPPPPDVDTTPVPARAGLSRRGVAESRIANSACGACHGRFETLSFALEKFDGLGAYREKDEHGNMLREDGEVLFPGAKDPIPYQSAEGFMDLLAESDRVQKTLTRKLVQFAMGRPLVAADAAIVDKIHRDAKQADGGTYQSLITAIVTSPLVRESRRQEVP